MRDTVNIYDRATVSLKLAYVESCIHKTQVHTETKIVTHSIYAIRDIVRCHYICNGAYIVNCTVDQTMYVYSKIYYIKI